jgi:predicted metal-dependent phosphoesterase TrpH
MSSEEAVELIHNAGGVAILAHPVSSRWKTPEALESQLIHAKSYGLDGLEVYYSQHKPEQRSIYLALAQKHGLLKSAGSDFHGAPKPHIKLGEVNDGERASANLINDLLAAFS